MQQVRLDRRENTKKNKLKRSVLIYVALSLSEWVSDRCLTPIKQFFQLYHGENKLIFNEMMMRSALF